MKAYLVANLIPNPDGQEPMQYYASKVGQLLTAAGGTNAKRVKLSEIINGSSLFKLMLFMEFESKKAIQGVFESAEYKALIPYRDKGFDMVNIQIFEDL